MTDELVKRLRGWAKDIQQGSTAVWAMDQDLKEAAYRIESLTADNARLRKALTFYADEENYKSRLSTDPCGCCTTWDEPIIHIYGDDSGHIARAALTGKEPSHE